MGTRNLPGPGRRTPNSTYRLQLGPDLSFDDVAARLDYYIALGITDLYLSPILAAAPGSTHGYDVVDHARISDVMGGREAFERLRDPGPWPWPGHRRRRGAQPHGRPDPGVPQPGPLVGPGRGHRLAVRVLVRRGLGLVGGAHPHADPRRPDRRGPRRRRRCPWRRPSSPATATSRRRSCATTSTCSRCAPAPESLPLAELVERQFYRLAYWHVADEELNYRRFFDIDTLAAVRVEDPTRSSTPPTRSSGAVRRGPHRRRSASIIPTAWPIPGRLPRAARRGHRRGRGSSSRRSWRATRSCRPTGTIAGTTGYDAMWRVQALFVDPDGGRASGKLWRQITGDARGDLEAIIDEAKAPGRRRPPVRRGRPADRPCSPRSAMPTSGCATTPHAPCGSA